MSRARYYGVSKVCYIATSTCNTKNHTQYPKRYKKAWVCAWWNVRVSARNYPIDGRAMREEQPLQVCQLVALLHGASIAADRNVRLVISGLSRWNLAGLLPAAYDIIEHTAPKLVR
jgi:hypothetical protein